VKEIPLVNGRGVAIVDDEDFDLLSQHRWYLKKGKRTSYALTYIAGRGKYMHRLLRPEVHIVDHKDGNGLNNQKENFRACTSGQNQTNSAPRFGRRFKGVYRERGQFYAAIRRDGRLRRLGSYATEEEAARRYDQAALIAWGEFARLNFPMQQQAAALDEAA
jgi:hypothetical protein